MSLIEAALILYCNLYTVSCSIVGDTDYYFLSYLKGCCLQIAFFSIIFSLGNFLIFMIHSQGELEACKRELTAVGEKERQTRVKNKHLASKLKQEEDEVR